MAEQGEAERAAVMQRLGWGAQISFRFMTAEDPPREDAKATNSPFSPFKDPLTRVQVHCFLTERRSLICGVRKRARHEQEAEGQPPAHMDHTANRGGRIASELNRPIAVLSFLHFALLVPSWEIASMPRSRPKEPAGPTGSTPFSSSMITSMY